MRDTGRGRVEKNDHGSLAWSTPGLEGSRNTYGHEARSIPGEGLENGFFTYLLCKAMNKIFPSSSLDIPLVSVYPSYNLSDITGENSMLEKLPQILFTTFGLILLWAFLQASNNLGAFIANILQYIP